MSRSLFKKLVIAMILLPLLLFTASIAFIYSKQDAIVQELLSKLNADFKGEIKISDSHISPFANFPYVSVDLDHLQVFEDKSQQLPPVVNVNDVYLGFNVFAILSGNTEIKSIKLKDGFIHVIQDTLGGLNLLKAFETQHPVESAEEEFHLDIQSIELINIDITKYNASNKMTVETFVNKAKSKFKTSPEHVIVSLDSKFIVNVIQGTDTSFFKHKHVELKTQLDYDTQKELLSIVPSNFDLEQVKFDFQGSIDFTNGLYLDLLIKGNKPNFDLLIAVAPEELVPTLKKYGNKGKIDFVASLKGQLQENKMPEIAARFSCEDAYIENFKTGKKLDQLNFKATFSSKASGKPEDMAFSLTDFSSRPEAGVFKGHLKIKNFESPEIDTKIISDFDLDFLSKFLSIEGLENLKGNVKLTMNFRDIIDLNQPEKAIEKFNESYFTELDVRNLSFKSNDYQVPIENLNINATLEGHKASIKQFDLKVGKSDLSIKGYIDDLPAILHHSKNPVEAHLEIKSKWLDVLELTKVDSVKNSGIDEQIENLSLKFSFKSSARAFTESPNLPVGEFFIDELYAKMKHYPHVLHDFHADVLIDSSHFKVIDFSGVIDKSDFHFNGKLYNYNLWFMDLPKGDTKLDFDLNSKHFYLKDVFAYKGENFVPEDYRNEELIGLKLHGSVDLHYKDSLHSTDLYLERFQTQLKQHQCHVENFKGRVHLEQKQLSLDNFSGQLGKSDFKVSLNYFLGDNRTIQNVKNFFSLQSSTLDFDELFSYSPPPAGTLSPQDHEKGFNIYELPFSDMAFSLDIKHLNYHRYLINNMSGKLRTTPNHYLYVDTLMFSAAEGNVNLKGYFNGSNKDKIYFKPDLKLKNINLDKLLFKFENFGQDHLVSENLHGKLTGRITGNLRMHRDLVPIINESELHMDIEVSEGKLEKYAPLEALAEYFMDKNVSKVLFDTLKNHLDINKGVMSFPFMTINSSLGFIEVAGKQDMDLNMEYYIKIPAKLIGSVVKQKLFGSNRNENQDPEKEDEIVYKDDSKKIKYINLKLTGNSEKYQISLVKNKKD
jgi:hypothetical protein